MIAQSLIVKLQQAFRAAIAEVAGQSPDEVDAMVRPAGDPKFGDYQCNAAMPLAKPLKAKPRGIAERIAAAAQKRLADVVEPLELAGPGFINVRLKDDFLAQFLGQISAPEGGDETAAVPDRVGLPPVDRPETVVIDYSSPNIAKQMHVGHLRSTIIGDVFARVLAFLGHDVKRQNHVGDWGTQFGMLIAWYRRNPLPTPRTHDDVLAAIEGDYKQAQAKFKEDAEFAAEARQAVGELQSGDPAARQTWEQICAVSRQAFLQIYHRLNVLLTDADVCGESFYNDKLADVVAELQQRLGDGAGAAPSGRRAELREDRGAQCIFLYEPDGAPAFKNPDGDPLPMIIRKSDGAFLYATTDLAALRYRVSDLAGDRLIYVTDARQKLHFEMLFAIARAADLAPPDVRLEHVTFGSVLGEDRRPLKTREGENIKLSELLDEAERRALAVIAAREEEERQAAGQGASAALPSGEKENIARRVGIAAVKYADLRNDRRSDYVFGWDKMLAMQGNTAPYMLYAYARIRSIYRKAAEEAAAPDVYAAGTALHFHEPAERMLALRLARLREVIETVASDLEPHVLCSYLYDLATDFSRFYESCPVIQAPDDATRLSRLRLCDLTARALKLGLGLLGIATIERM
jgi:arginyl-tRNA synthetase